MKTEKNYLPARDETNQTINVTLEITKLQQIGMPSLRIPASRRQPCQRPAVPAAPDRTGGTCQNYREFCGARSKAYMATPQYFGCTGIRLSQIVEREQGNCRITEGVQSLLSSRRRVKTNEGKQVKTQGGHSRRDNIDAKPLKAAPFATSTPAERQPNTELLSEAPHAGGSTPASRTLSPMRLQLPSSENTDPYRAGEIETSLEELRKNPTV